MDRLYVVLQRVDNTMNSLLARPCRGGYG